MKLKDCVRPFDGKDDVVEWLDRYEKMVELVEEKKPAIAISAFLHGPAYAAYTGMEKSRQKDMSEVKRCLMDTFALGKIDAYMAFKSRVLQPGETVDVFLSSLRQLAKLGNIEHEELVRSAFVTGLPQEVICQIRATTGFKSASLSEVLLMAKEIISQRSPKLDCNLTRTSDEGQWCGVAIQGDGGHSATGGRVNPSDRRQRPTFLRRKDRDPNKDSCFRCGEIGHYARGCRRPSKDTSSQGNAKVDPSAPAGSADRQ